MLKLTNAVARSLTYARPISMAGRLNSAGDLMEKWPAEKFDKHFIDYLSRPEIDGWEVRKGLSFILLRFVWELLSIDV